MTNKYNGESPNYADGVDDLRMTPQEHTTAASREKETDEQTYELDSRHDIVSQEPDSALNPDALYTAPAAASKFKVPVPKAGRYAQSHEQGEGQSYGDGISH